MTSRTFGHVVAFLFIGILAIAFSGCVSDTNPRVNYRSGTVERFVRTETAGQAADGANIEVYTIQNANGLKARITNYGAIMLSLIVPDKRARYDDIILGFDTPQEYLREEYVANCPYFGAVVGRYANRIAGGAFTLDDRKYTLATNDGDNHLHGGTKGFDKVFWTLQNTFENKDRLGIVLHYRSPDGEEGYPGTLDCTVSYALSSNNELIVAYEAATDKETIVNLSQHNYFNLAGHGSGDILDHELKINAGYITPVDAGLIPTGELMPVDGTRFDFRAPTEIGNRIECRKKKKDLDEDDIQILRGGGYDHNFVLNRGKPGYELEFAARVVEPTSGRIMEVFTTEPGLQFYSGNFLDGTIIGKDEQRYHHRGGFCLETQRFPDTPNQPRPEFPPAVLKPGEIYQHKTVFRFKTR